MSNSEADAKPTEDAAASDGDDHRDPTLAPTPPDRGEFAQKYGPWAVVTGAAAGVGLAFTEALMIRGLDVVMVDVSPEIEAVGAGLSARLGRRHRAVEVDVSSSNWIELLRQACDGEQIGLAVANAGVAFVGHYLDMEPADRARLIAVNCGATAELASWALPPMVERGRGAFIAMSSGSALAGTGGVALYSATKAFGVNLVEAIGWELRGTGVDTLAVCGPSMRTPAFLAENPDFDRMAAPMAEPAVIVSAALDDLGRGGRWIPDESMALVTTVERQDAVALMSEVTTGMYPEIFANDDP